MDATRLWCRLVFIGPDGERGELGSLEGTGRPHLGAVDTVARTALAASRAGGRLVLSDVAPELRDLLRLAGLLAGDEPSGTEGGDTGLIIPR